VNSSKIIQLSIDEKEVPVNKQNIMQQAIDEKVWGIASSFDIYHCNPETIRNADKIKQFGEDERVAGFSMVQLIETSLISAHFANLTNATYLDVFSCKPYDPELVADFAKNFFGGSEIIIHANLRR
jgi:hypothetical protein